MKISSNKLNPLLKTPATKSKPNIVQGEAVKRGKLAPKTQLAQRELIDQFEKALGAQSPHLLETYKTLPPSARKELLGLYRDLTEGKLAPELQAKFKDNPEALRKFRERIVTDTLTVLSKPRRVIQGDNPTCALASVERMLVYKAPTKYVKLLRELITKGETRTSNGITLKVDREVASALQRALDYNDGGRLTSSAILQTAMAKSIHPKAVEDGLKPYEQKRLLDGLLSGKYSTYYNLERSKTYKNGVAELERLREHLKKLKEALAKETSPERKEELKKFIKWEEESIAQKQRFLAIMERDGITKDKLLEIIKRGEPVPALLLTHLDDKIGHAIIIKGMEGNNVLIDDPFFNSIVRMPLDKFLQQLYCVQLHNQ